MTNNKNEQKTLLAYQGSDIAFEYIEGKLMINATQMAKSFNKFPKDWLKTQQAKDLIGAVGSVNKILLTDLQLVRNGGENPGTWFPKSTACSAFPMRNTTQATARVAPTGLPTMKCTTSFAKPTAGHATVRN